MVEIPLPIDKYFAWLVLPSDNRLAKSPILDIDYDVRNLPISPVIATYAYSGPPIAACGNPEITLEDDVGSNLNFLTAAFDSVEGIITISLPDVNTAVKGAGECRVTSNFGRISTANF